MLENFDQAKRDLTQIRGELLRCKRAGGSNENEIGFLKSRALDLLQDIYIDSTSTLEHIKGTFNSSTLDEVISTIDRALAINPPLRRALSSEDDSKTLLTLVDAVIWRSRFVWACGIGAVVAVIIALALLGISVADLNKQAEAAHKFLDDAKVRLDDNIKAVNVIEGNLKGQIQDFEGKKDAINNKINGVNDLFNNSTSEINKTISRFTEEISHLEQLERDWSQRRAALTAALAQHDSFLIGKEAEVIQRTTGLLQHSDDKVKDIDAAAETAQTQAKAIQESAGSSKKNSDALQALLDPAQKSAARLEELKTQGQAVADEIAGTKTRVKALEQDIGTIGDRIKAAGDLSDKRAKEIDAQAQDARKNLDATATAALGAVTTSRDATIGKINRIETEATEALNSAETAASRHVNVISAAANQADQQSTQISQTAKEMGGLRTDYAGKLEELKTEGLRVKGERDREKLELGNAQDIIKIVEDKHASTADQLHKLLDEKPDIDAASVWKLILGARTLQWLTAAVLVLLLIIVGWLIALGRRIRHATHPAAVHVKSEDLPPGVV